MIKKSLFIFIIFKAATSIDGLDLNYRVVYVEDACRGIDPNDIEKQKKFIAENGGVVVKTDKVR